MNHLGTRWRGKIPIPNGAHPLVQALLRIANNEMTTITEIAIKAGLERQTVSHWRYAHNPILPNLEAAGGALGYDLVWKKREPK